MTKYEKQLAADFNHTAKQIIAYREGELTDTHLDVAIRLGGITVRRANAIRTGDLTLLSLECYWHLAADAQAMIDAHNQAAA